jgi:hypothetical protein
MESSGIAPDFASRANVFSLESNRFAKTSLAKKKRHTPLNARNLAAERDWPKNFQERIPPNLRRTVLQWNRKFRLHRQG